LGWAFLGLLGGEGIQKALGWVYGVPLGAVKGISDLASWKVQTNKVSES